MTALNELIVVFRYVFGSVTVLAIIGLGITAVRQPLSPTSDDKKAMTTSHIFHILGITACIGAICLIASWAYEVIGEYNPTIEKFLRQINRR